MPLSTVTEHRPQLHAHAISLPRGSLIAAAVLIGFSLLAVTTARLLHWRGTVTPPAAVITELHLTFSDRSDGGIEVRDADHAQQLIYSVPPETNGFMRGVLRGLARARRNEHVGQTPAFTLTRWSDGRLTITDPQTGHSVPLEVFGPSNSLPFAKLLAADEQALSGLAAHDLQVTGSPQEKHTP
jgi:putative photosynthetic complex assembly protein